MSVKKRKLVKELYTRAKKFSALSRSTRYLWQADVVEKRPYAWFNKDYNYILTVIDVLSKYAWAIPFKSKNGNDIGA